MIIKKYISAVLFAAVIIGYLDKGFYIDVSRIHRSNEYFLSAAQPELKGELNPADTDFEEFERYTNRELSYKITGNTYIGDFCFDKKNSVVFFNAETH